MKHMLLGAILYASAAIVNAAIRQDESPIELADGPSHRETVASLLPDVAHVEQRGDQILVHAQTEVDANRTIIWSTLSDYDNLARFIPYMSSSRTLCRNGSEAIVEQKGSVSLGPIHRTFTMLLEVREEPDDSISVSSVAGDLELVDIRYDIIALTAHRSRLVYEATIVPGLPLPSLLTLPVMRSMVNRQFGALVHEMRRRAQDV